MKDVERLAAIGFAPPLWGGEAAVFPKPVPSKELRDRYRGSLLAGAIGDALGRPAEGRSRQDLGRRWPHGLRDFQPWHGYRSGPVGTFTDDTQLTIVVARWLIQMGTGELNAAPLAEAIEIWGDTGRGIGRATHEALALMRLGRPWWQSGVASAGNGAAMRAAPHALRFAGEPDRLRYAAALGSVPTHADQTAIAAAVVQAVGVNHCLAAIAGALDPDALLEALVGCIADLDLPALAPRGTGERRTLSERIREVGALLGRRTDDVLDHFFNGAFVLETTPVVLWLLLSYCDDPEQALVQAVMAGRDADTIAAMLGNLLGALHGTDAFPDRWRGDNLEDHDGLVELADQLYDLRWPESG